MEPLLDPLNDRFIKYLSPPPHKPLLHELLFDNDDRPNLENLKNHLLREGKITKKDFLKIMERVASIMSKKKRVYFYI